MKETPKPFTVSGLTEQLKTALESRFSRIYVEAEISGWRKYPSGHAYFTLKDSGAQMSAVMFASALARCRAAADLKDGAKVVVYGNVSVYAPRGNYQLVVLAAKLAGVGELMQRYLELKARLEAEGLFDKTKKRPLPFLPRRIGLVTSQAGAVVHDMCTVLTRRFPLLEIRLFPCQVQGAAAAESIIRGIEHFNGPAADGWRADILIVARGGGSFEDLFCFNDESLVRSVAASQIPVISAVGHETDFTLCDFAADVRAGTPSMAAELAVPVMSDLQQRISVCGRQLVASLRSRWDFFSQRIDHLADAMSSSLAARLSDASHRLDRAAPALASALALALASAEHRVERVSPALAAALKLRLQSESSRVETLSERLRLLSPYGVLERGYSLTTASDGSVVRDAASLRKGDHLVTRLARGAVESEVVASQATGISLH